MKRKRRRGKRRKKYAGRGRLWKVQKQGRTGRQRNLTHTKKLNIV